MPVGFWPTPPRYLALPRRAIWLPIAGFLPQTSHCMPMAGVSGRGASLVENAYHSGARPVGKATRGTRLAGWWSRVRPHASHSEAGPYPRREGRVMGLILLIVLLLLLLGGLPTWGYSRNWGYAPSGLRGLLLVVLVVLVLCSVVAF